METVSTPFGDFIQPFQIERPGLRGRLVRLGPVVEAVLAGHAYPRPVADLLAESLALGTVLASGLKYEGTFTLQMQGEGPIGLLIVDIGSNGDIRGYARFDVEGIGALGSSEDAVPRLFGGGRMAFTVDQGPDTDRYQSITNLEGASLTECAHTYFRQSDQLETAIKLCGSGQAVGAGGRRAAALMIQRLPGAAELEMSADDDWRRAVALMSSVTSAELLSPDIEANALLYRLFHEDGIRVFHRREVRHRCRCSRERVENVLSALPADDIQSLLEDGRITVTCEFCGRAYVFEDRDVAAFAAGN